MKKEYMKPEAEKVVFDYSENVTASTNGGANYPTTDATTQWWECHNRYDDAAEVCGQDGHEVSTPFWRCNNK